jgi:hypothetical protein
VEESPTPSAYYHLALSFARPGPSHDLDQATVNAGLAVESDPKEIRYWHLIGLLLAASERWKAAEEILAQGAEIGETPQEDEPSNGHGNPELLMANGHGTNGRAIDGLPVADATPVMKRLSMPPEPLAPVFILDKPKLGMPPATDLLLPAPDHAAPSRQESFEYSLQLRMTQVALIEHVDGPEGAAEKWLEVFQWIAERRGVTGSSSSRVILSLEAHRS